MEKIRIPRIRWVRRMNSYLCIYILEISGDYILRIWSDFFKGERVVREEKKKNESLDF
jgi:hypothetical protein